MPFQLQDLPYAYTALEPHIDAQTVEIHYTKHHHGYCERLNGAIKGTPFESEKSIEVILAKGIAELPMPIRNNGGGYANHNLFWKVMSPDGGGTPDGELAEALISPFSNFEGFKKEFSIAAEKEFGSGWAWLVVNAGRLEVFTTHNQDSPLMFGKTPILGLDVWEHAYYLKYKNDRLAYVSSWWNLVDWKTVGNNFTKTLRK